MCRRSPSRLSLLALKTLARCRWSCRDCCATTQGLLCAQFGKHGFFAAASHHLEQAEHQRYLAHVENNLGFLYLKINYFKEAHEQLNRARRKFAKLNDKITLAQCDETRARVFLKEQRYVEAEKAARASVQNLKNSGRPALEAESLKRHGIALARLGLHSDALSAFRRSVHLSKETGLLNRAADAALTAFEELEERLAIKDVITLSGKPADQEVLLLEHELFKHALVNTQGRVTFAARSLGMGYQKFTHKLNTKHTDLLKYRTPVRQRKRRK